ncbi:MAG: 5-(carboxyamino)imidazole ribonucleotide mutase [Saccharofermentanales bacterium]
MEQKPEVLVVMGSDSDFTIMQSTFQILSQFAVPYSAVVCSAHRTPDAAAVLSKEAESKGIKVIIAAAGLAAHLPGVIAAYTILPVIGVPISSGALKGIDSLYSIVQMPTGIPVATVTINGAENAALLAVQILALSDPDLKGRLMDHKKHMVEVVDKRNESLQKKMKEFNY